MPRARHRDTGHEFDFADAEWPAYQRAGWEIIGDDGTTESGTQQSPQARREFLLAAVANDPEKALELFETESAVDEPDDELLAELERIASAEPTPED